MSRPLVSVLVPVFNRERFIRRCVESALEQTEAHLEVVVVDNASIDRTWDICQDLAVKDHRVRIFRNPTNIGAVRNWRRCLDEARGKFGKFLFSDDLIRPQFLEKTVPLLGDTNVAFAFTALDSAPEVGRGRPYFRWRRGKLFSPSAWYIEDALFSIGECQYSPGAALFRVTDLSENLRIELSSPFYDDFPDHGGGNDLLLFLLTAARYEKVAYVDEPLAYFESHSGSTTASRRYPDLFNRYHQARVNFAVEHGMASAQRRLLALAWVQNCIHRRRWVSPKEVSKLFVSHGETPGYSDLPWAVANELRRWKHYVRRLASITTVR